MLALADQEGHESLWSGVECHIISAHIGVGCPPPAPPILAQRTRGHGPWAV